MSVIGTVPPGAERWVGVGCDPSAYRQWGASTLGSNIPGEARGKEAVWPVSRFELVVVGQSSPCRCCSVSTGRCSASVITGSAFVSTRAPSFSAVSHVKMSQFDREQVTGSQWCSLHTKSPKCRSLNWRARVVLL